MTHEARLLRRRWIGRIVCLCPALCSLSVATSAADAQVNQEWVAQYENAAAADVEVAPDGSVYVVGSETIDAPARDYAVVLMKYHPDGTLVWSRTWNPYPRQEWARGIEIDSNGDVIVAAETTPDPFTHSGVAVLKYDADGNLLWDRIWEGNGWVALGGGHRALALDSTGAAIVCGEVTPPSYDTDAFTLKYDTDGHLLWIRNVSGPYVQRALGAAVDADDNIYATGMYEPNLAPEDVFLVKYSPSGSQLYLRFYDNGGRSEWANALALDTDGNVLITGTTEGERARSLLVLKYTASGSFLWKAEYDGPSTNGFEYGHVITTDAAGDVYVGAETKPDGEPFEQFSTLCFDSSGSFRWIREIVDYYGRPTDIQIDHDGGVLVTGAVYSRDETPRAVTVKYARSDGATLWQSEYTGSGSAARSYALALDQSNNVYIAGSSLWSDVLYATTIKYSQGGPALSVLGSCPGGMRFKVTGATSGERVAFLYARRTGGASIPPGNPCQGTRLGLNQTVQLADVIRADGAGKATLDVSVPAFACGRVYVQAIDLGSCATSNVLLVQ